MMKRNRQLKEGKQKNRRAGLLHSEPRKRRWRQEGRRIDNYSTIPIAQLPSTMHERH